MAQISKRKVAKTIEIKMLNTLWEAIAKLKSQKEIQSFLNDLLSPTERIMVTKRLAIAALLLKKYNYESIMEIVKVSNGTVAKIAFVLNSNVGYKNTINKISRAESTREFWQDVERLLHRIAVTSDTFKSEEALKWKFGHERKTLL